MGFAEEFEKNKKVFVIVAVLVLVALVVVVMNLSGGPPKPPGTSAKARLYYTVDDGKTYFEDDADRLPPFDHEGKPAYLAKVYRCGTDGSPFVAYLQRIEDGARKEAEAARAAKKRPMEVEAIWLGKVEVKKPGDPKWVSAGKPAAEKVMIVTCPEGKIPAIVVP
jgi:hypothetical protein